MDSHSNANKGFFSETHIMCNNMENYKNRTNYSSCSRKPLPYRQIITCSIIQTNLITCAIVHICAQYVTFKNDYINSTKTAVKLTKSQQLFQKKHSPLLTNYNLFHRPIKSYHVRYRPYLCAVFSRYI